MRAVLRHVYRAECCHLSLGEDGGYELAYAEETRFPLCDDARVATAVILTFQVAQPSCDRADHDAADFTKTVMREHVGQDASFY